MFSANGNSCVKEIQSVSLIPAHNLLVNFILDVNYYHLIISSCLVDIILLMARLFSCFTQLDILQNHFDIVMANLGNFFNDECMDIK